MLSERQREGLKKFMIDKGGCCCCGKKKKLTFHHLDSAEKKSEISKLTTNKELIEEVSKCVIVCRTCHSKYFHPFMDNFNSFYKNKTYKRPKTGNEGISKRDLMAKDFFHSIQNREFCECCGKKKNLHLLIHPLRRDKINLEDIRAEDMDYSSSLHMVCSSCSHKLIMKYQKYEERK